MSNRVHVLPVDDLIEHETSEDCVCVPRATLVPRDDGSDGWLITHNSLDGRELSEADYNPDGYQPDVSP